MTGLAVRGPGGVGDVGALLAALRSGRTAAGPMPPGPRREAWQEAGGTEVRGGFLRHPESLPAEALHEGAQAAARWPWLHRLLISVVQPAWAEAGRPSGRVGVFVGAAPPEPTAADDQASELDVDSSVAAGRLARALDLDGPTLVVDTACSSGAVALHLARQALLAGECDHAIVASASAIAAPRRWARIQALGALSQAGHSLPFDDRADGFLRAEGAVALVLSRHAPASGALGWLVASAVGHEGRTAHPGVPSARAQATTAAAALAQTGLAPHELALVHPHGTGTPLGDRVELEALDTLWPDALPPLLATKAVLGHTEAPSALFGVAAALGCLQAQQGPGLPHVERPVDGRALPRPAHPLDGDHALVLANGLSGTLAAVVLRRGERAATARIELATPQAPPQAALPATGLAATLRKVTARVLDREPEALDPGRPLRDQGLDSVAAVALADALAEALGRPIRPTVALEHGTLRALLDHLEPPAAVASPRPPLAAPTRRPVAVLAATCLLPGIDSVPALLDTLDLGAPGPRRLPDDEGLDAPQIGLDAHEADALGPTLRLTLDRVHAAADAAGLHDAREVGVFVAAAPEPLSEAGWEGPLRGAGREQSFVAGRIAAHFGWEGPAVAVNTACSSGLVAAGLALDALRAGRCEQAVVVGCRMHLADADHEQLAAMGVLSPTGQIRPFDAAADGTVRGEGVVVVVLGRGDALGARSPLGWLRAVAIAHDHGAGLAAPSVAGQQQVVARALATAGVDAAALAFVESHGTGTRRGDAVEAAALHAALGPRAELPVTCAKGVFGHLEHAAGLLGLVAAIEQLRRGHLAPVGGYAEASDALQGTLVVPVGAQGRPLPADARFAGVSSFGVSGTIAHAIIERALPPDAAPPRHDPVLWPLWGRDPDACAQLLDELVADPSPQRAGPVRVAASLAGRRGAWVGVARVPAEGEPTVVAEPAEVAAQGPTVAWLCPGAGAWRPGLAEGLRHHPAFREVVAEAREVVEPILGPGVLAHDTADIAWRQVDTVVTTLGLAAMLQAGGLQPDHVAGHSVGELAAAALAGVLSRRDALVAVAERGRLYRTLPAGGAMVAVPQGPDEAEATAARHGLAVAAHQHPGQSILSGAEPAVQAVLAEVSGARQLAVPGAWHHPDMAPLVAPFTAVMAQRGLAPPRLPLRSGLDGRYDAERVTDPSHWGRLVRAPVAWSEVVVGLVEDGVTTFVELGPHPLLLPAVAAHPDAAGARLVPSLRRDLDDRDAWAQLLCGLAAAGARVPAAAWAGGDAASVADLPQGARRVTHPARDAAPRIARRTLPLRVPVGVTVAEATAPQPAASPPLRLPPDGIDDPIAAAVDAVRALVAAPSAQRVVLQGALPWLGSDAPDLAAAAVAGVVRCAQRERPLALGPAGSPTGEPVVDGPAGRRLGLRLREVPPSPPPALHGTWLITGGTGSLGLHTARWLRAHGVERVVLLSRSGTPRPSDGPLPEGAQVVCGDVSEAAVVDEALAAAGPTLRGVVHAVGVLDDRPLASLDGVAIATVMTGKVRGAQHLVRALADRADVHLVFFSSAAALFGSPGQAAYGAANAVLDALAVQRRATGGPTTSIAWGPWAEHGLAARGGALVSAQQRALGLRPLAPAAALEAFGAALARPEPVVVVVDADWRTTRRAWPDDPLVAGLVDAPMAPSPAPPAAPSSVHDIAQAVAGRPLDPAARLDEQGLDSFRLVELANALARAGHEVPLERVLEGGPLQALLPRPAATPSDDVPRWAWVVVLAVGAVLGALATALVAMVWA